MVPVRTLQELKPILCIGEHPSIIRKTHIVEVSPNCFSVALDVGLFHRPYFKKNGLLLINGKALQIRIFSWRKETRGQPKHAIHIQMKAIGEFNINPDWPKLRDTEKKGISRMAPIDVETLGMAQLWLTIFRNSEGHRLGIDIQKLTQAPSNEQPCDQVKMAPRLIDGSLEPLSFEGREPLFLFRTNLQTGFGWHFAPIKKQVVVQGSLLFRTPILLAFDVMGAQSIREK